MARRKQPIYQSDENPSADAVDPSKKPRGFWVWIAISSVLSGAVVCLGVSVAEPWLNRRLTADQVGNAVWFSAPGSPARLLLAEAVFRSSEDGSYTVNRLVALDPRTGAATDTVLLHGDDNDTVPELVAARGPWIFTLAGERRLVRKLGEEPIPLIHLSDRFPQVLPPWASVVVARSGLLLVESDDKKRWLIDLVAGTATERTPMDLIDRDMGKSLACHDDRWVSGERTYAFAKRETTRHSQHDNWALITATAGEYAELSETGEVATGYASPSFLCNPQQGTVMLGSDALLLEAGDSLVFSRLTASGTRVWTWKAPSEQGTNWLGTQAWSVSDDLGEGVIVRNARFLTRLDGQGAVRWTIKR